VGCALREEADRERIDAFTMALAAEVSILKGVV
jgi:hypothetical protein